jgi:hypothetical protein
MTVGFSDFKLRHYRNLTPFAAPDPFNTFPLLSQPGKAVQQSAAG